MAFPISGLVVIRKVEAFSKASLPVNSVKNKTTYSRPTSLFLVYIMQDGAGHLDVRHMYDYECVDIKKAELRLCQLAKSSTQTPAYVGRNFKNLLWRFPCYLTLVLDVPGMWFNGESDPNEDPLVFNEEK